ncbi:DUF4197 family protein [Novosphingobium decolorationis]|nr:DUF4197 family protein [Novosphingobium decolorationis]
MDRDAKAPMWNRRGLLRRGAGWGLAGLGAGLGMGLAFPANAQGLGGTLTGLLVQASDSSLDKLARPGAFYDDPDVRIDLPLIGGLLGGKSGTRGGFGQGLGAILGAGSPLDLTGGLVRAVNDAAGVAAGAAKPVFRTAIRDLDVTDVPGIASRSDGATRYLRTSAGEELHGALRPLVDDGLEEVGAYRQLDRLTTSSRLVKSAGLTRDALGGSVTEQALDGIFAYIGREEANLRADPLKPLGGLLRGVLGQ